MAITNGYCTLSEVKAALGIDDADDDEILERVVESVSRTIDAICGRFFHSQGATVRYYTPIDYDFVFIDDLQSGTGNSITINTDGGDRTYSDTWAATDYDLMPYNAEAEGFPHTWIERTPQGNYSFPKDVKKGVKITGDWGWAAVPSAIKSACILYSQRVFKRKDALFGVLGTSRTGELVNIMSQDPDVMMMLDPYIKRFQ